MLSSNDIELLNTLDDLVRLRMLMLETIMNSDKFSALAQGDAKRILKGLKEEFPNLWDTRNEAKEVR